MVDSSVKRIGFYTGLDLLGDAFIKLPMVQHIHRAYPEAEIIWWAGRGKTVFSNHLAFVADAWGLKPIEHKLYETKTLPGILKKEFDVFIDTQARPKVTRHLKKTINAKTFIASTFGFYFSDKKPTSKRLPVTRLSYQLLDIATLLNPRAYDHEPLAIGTEYKEWVKNVVCDHKAKSGYIGLVVGAGNKVKQWPLENFIRLAHELHNHNKPVMFILGPDENVYYDRLKKECPFALFPLQQVDKLTVPHLIALVDCLEVVVAGDCGPSHVLGFQGTPILSLFGPTRAAKFLPFAPANRYVQAKDINHLPWQDVFNQLLEMVAL